MIEGRKKNYPEKPMRGKERLDRKRNRLLNPLFSKGAWVYINTQQKREGGKGSLSRGRRRGAFDMEVSEGNCCSSTMSKGEKGIALKFRGKKEGQTLVRRKFEAASGTKGRGETLLRSRQKKNIGSRGKAKLLCQWRRSCGSENYLRKDARGKNIRSGSGIRDGN